VQEEIFENTVEGEYGSNLDTKCFWLKQKLRDAVCYADSEYHVYFAPESTFDHQNAEIQY
jgi:hypothetical protein